MRVKFGMSDKRHYLVGAFLLRLRLLYGNSVVEGNPVHVEQALNTTSGVGL